MCPCDLQRCGSINEFADFRVTRFGLQRYQFAPDTPVMTLPLTIIGAGNWSNRLCNPPFFPSTRLYRVLDSMTNLGVNVEKINRLSYKACHEFTRHNKVKCRRVSDGRIAKVLRPFGIYCKRPRIKRSKFHCCTKSCDSCPRCFSSPNDKA